MKFATHRPFVDPTKAARKLIEIANAAEAVQDGRIYTERVNASFLAAGGCAYRKSHPAILMVQSAQDRAADDIPGRLNVARNRGILAQ